MTYEPRSTEEAKDLAELEKARAEEKRVGALRLRREAAAMLAALERAER